MQLLVSLYVLLLDQLLKWRLVDGAPVNGGIGWGLLSGTPLLATVVVGLVSLAVLLAIDRAWSRLSSIRKLGAAVVGAGVASNLIDRIRVGGVIDPLSVGEWFPHFNLADGAIVIGLLVLVLTNRSFDPRDDRHRLERSG